MGRACQLAVLSPAQRDDESKDSGYRAGPCDPRDAVQTHVDRQVRERRGSAVLPRHRLHSHRQQESRHQAGDKRELLGSRIPIGQHNGDQGAHCRHPDQENSRVREIDAKKEKVEQLVQRLADDHQNRQQQDPKPEGGILRPLEHQSAPPPAEPWKREKKKKGDGGAGGEQSAFGQIDTVEKNNTGIRGRDAEYGAVEPAEDVVGPDILKLIDPIEIAEVDALRHSRILPDRERIPQQPRRRDHDRHGGAGGSQDDRDCAARA